MGYSDHPVVAAIDIGGTNVRTALLSPLGVIMAKDRFSSRTAGGAEDLARRAAESVKDLARDTGVNLAAISALGCSVPGPLDRRRGIVAFSPHLNWRDVPLEALIREHLPMPFTMDDDANCAALGETYLGGARTAKDMVYVTISTGIGAGIVIDGRLYRGSHGLAGEVGHMQLVSGGPECSCGNYGCFEAVASGSAIADRARQAIREGAATSLRHLATNADDLTAEVVLRAAALGDDLAIHIAQDVAVYLGIGLAAIASAFDPQVIVLGGGVMLNEYGLLERARNEFVKRAIAPIGDLVTISPAHLGDESSLLGAALLAALDFDLSPEIIKAMQTGAPHVR